MVGFLGDASLIARKGTRAKNPERSAVPGGRLLAVWKNGTFFDNVYSAMWGRAIRVKWPSDISPRQMAEAASGLPQCGKAYL